LIVSGFFTSPKERSRIFSGDEIDILIAEKCNGSFGFSKKLKKSSKILSSFLGVGYRSPEHVRTRYPKLLCSSPTATIWEQEYAGYAFGSNGFNKAGIVSAQ
jgi:hypothetical protein